MRSEMDEQERYLKYIEPYRIYFLILEFVVMPIAAVLAGYVMGSISGGFAIAFGYLIADILVLVTRGRTLLGIKNAGAKPWKIPGARVISAVMAGLFLLVVGSVAVRELMDGQLYLGLASLSLVAMGICYLAARWLKRYERPLSFLSSLFILAMVLLIALYVENMTIRLIILLLALIWAFFVALGAYSLISRKTGVQS